MIIDKEDFEVQSSREFWAGRLIELPANEAWQIAKEITEAIEYAKANADNASDESEGCTHPVYNIFTCAFGKRQCKDCEYYVQTGNCV